MREELEAAVLPLAMSVDGRGFHFQTSLFAFVIVTGAVVSEPFGVITWRRLRERAR